MEVIIAGYNKTVDGFSPEVISASYARTSRSEKSIPEIREEAKLDVEKARQSNTNIVFGIGHSSIAEHVVFNIDIMGVSRFLVEEIESHRLTSYTEKSQRYVLFKGDYTIPDELNSKELKLEYINLIEEQNNFYQELYPILLDYFKKKNPEKYEKDYKTVEGWAKEDARYIISMATQTQLGMTINARNLELLIRRLNACPYIEAKQLAKMLYDKVYEIAPSLFPYVEPSISESNNKLLQYREESKEKGFVNNVFLLNFHEQNKDDEILEICKNVKIFDLLKNMKVHDSAPKEFEVVDFKFDLIMSSSCFAQLKRHRMMTIIPKMYNINYEPVIPISVIESNMEEKFMNIINKTNEFFRKTKCYYCLTNAHRREVFVKINLREMYHFCRMRMDGHAQWEIRDIANKMCEESKNLCPLGMTLCCGKDQFEKTYKENFETKK
jgi:flavin-dependent thymidylate synthase